MRWPLLVSSLALLACGSTQSSVEPSSDSSGDVSAVTNPDACAAAPDDGYPQWWSPSCATTCGVCTDPSCRPAQLRVSHASCGAYTAIEAGCIPNDTGNDGNTCLVRASDGEIIVTLDYPLIATGLSYCWDDGVPSTPGTPVPSCPDGGGL